MRLCNVIADLNRDGYGIEIDFLPSERVHCIKQSAMPVCTEGPPVHHGDICPYKYELAIMGRNLFDLGFIIRGEDRFRSSPWALGRRCWS
jgi:hypothetical protein